jgi:hypothetical protein
MDIDYVYDESSGSIKTMLIEKKDNTGRIVSPLLPEHVKNYLIDIDGTVGEDIPNEEPERMITSEAYSDAIETINRWHSEGHKICFFTARTEEHRLITENWLKKKGFQYHTLLMNKPRGGNYHWIDNHVVKATRYTS